MDSLLDVCQEAGYVNVSLQLSIKKYVLVVEVWEAITITYFAQSPYLLSSSTFFFHFKLFLF